MFEMKQVKCLVAVFLAFCLAIWGGYVTARAEAETAPSVIEEIPTSAPAPKPVKTDAPKQEESAFAHARDEQPNDALSTPSTIEGETQNYSPIKTPKNEPTMGEIPTETLVETYMEATIEAFIETPAPEAAPSPPGIFPYRMAIWRLTAICLQAANCPR